MFVARSSSTVVEADLEPNKRAGVEYPAQETSHGTVSSSTCLPPARFHAHPEKGAG